MLLASGKSIKGQTRPSNQDKFMIDNNEQLWIVADGMGGHKGGEQASAMACNLLPQLLQTNNNTLDAIVELHNEILLLSQEDYKLNGMAATIVLAQFAEPNDLHIYWLGDCRAYEVSTNKVSCLTKDHSRVQTLLDLGLISESEALTHPHRNLVTQCVGGLSVSSPSPGHVKTKIMNGSRILLCSDGLYNEVLEDEMAAILSNTENDDHALSELLSLADNNGGHDNITAVLLSSVDA